MSAIESLVQPETGTERSSLSVGLPTPATVGLVTVLAAIAVVALAPRIDPDLWWHVKVGAWIVAHHAVPSRDIYSFTMYGHAWTDHEWLSEVLMYWLYQLGGLWGPIVFFAGVIVVTFVLVYRTMRRLGISPFLAVFVLAACAFASSASWGPRVQMLSLLFLALFADLLSRYRSSGNRRLLIAFPVIMLLWANLHAGFVIGLAVLGIAIAGLLLERSRQRPIYVRPLLIAAAASFGVTILNPHGYRLLLYPLTFLAPNAFTNQIQESASPNFHTPVMMLFAGLLLTLLGALIVIRPRLDPTSLLTILAFTWLALSQARNVPLWSVAVGPVLAVCLQTALDHRAYSYRPRSLSRRRGALNLAVMVLVLGGLALEGSRFIGPRGVQTAVVQQYPTGAVAFMSKRNLPRDTLVSYNWSGYFIGRLGPRYLTFLDLRADTVFTPAVLDAYLAAYGAAPDWSATLQRYHVGTVLVERASPLAQVLTRSSKWRDVYKDSQAVVYVRRDLFR